MARDISELGADVFDDSPKKQHKISPKKRNYIIGLSLTGLLVAGALTAGIVLSNTVLLDYANVENVTYYFTQDAILAEGEEPYAVLYRLPSDRKFPSTFRIPSKIQGYKVVGVHDQAFAGHTEIKKVIMSNNIKWIGEEAFSNCTNLSTFTWSKNLNDVGVDAFKNTAFYNNLLNDSKALYDLPSGLLIYAGKDYFEGNTALISDSMTEAQISEMKANYTVSSVKKFSDLHVTGVCSGAFKNNTKITYIDLPESLDDIPMSTFEGCSNLEGLNGSHSQLTQIKKRAFADCVKLKDITLPDSLVELGDESFANTGVINAIPDISHVETLGERIFADCTKLTSVSYSSNVVGKYMFSGCSHLDTITWGEANANIDNITEIRAGAFEKTGFVTFVVPKQIKEINDFTFNGCTSLEKVSLYGNPNNECYPVEDDDEDEHVYPYVNREGEPCDELKGVQSIKESAFDGCTSLDTINQYGEDYSHYVGDDGNFEFPYSLVRCDVSSSSSLNNNTFRGTKPTKVYASPNLKHIGSYAFKGITTLTTFEVRQSSLSKLTTIKASAFEGCSNLATFTMSPTVIRIEDGAFKGCQSLGSLDIANTTITAVSAYAFYDCQNLEDLVLPEKVASIKANAFYHNYKLDYIVVPEAIREFLARSFTECRENEGDVMNIYISRTYPKSTSGIGKINFAKNWRDESAQEYFLYEEGDPLDEDPETHELLHKYWHMVGDVPTPYDPRA